MQHLAVPFAMNSHAQTDLLRAYRVGDKDAVRAMCDHFEIPLRRIVEAHLDPAVARRVSQSDIIQETWICAVAKLDSYARNPGIPLFAWLRQIAKERVIDAHRRHRVSQKRSVYREQEIGLSDASVNMLVDRLADLGPEPSEELLREERRDIVHRALGELKPIYREILVLRFLEKHSLEESAELLGIGREGAKSRQRRAISLLADQLGEPSRL